jgi:hypothetical protein
LLTVPGFIPGFARIYPPSLVQLVVNCPQLLLPTST